MQDARPEDQLFDGDVYDYVEREAAAYKTAKVPLIDGRWEWSMFDHVNKSTAYKNSKFFKGKNDGVRPFKNINRPILNVAYRSEGFDVKDVEPFVDDPKDYYKSFFVRRFHPRWAREHGIDAFIDSTVESFVDYGLALSKRVPGKAPENVNLQTIEFCDTTDILGGPICILHQFTPDQLTGPDAPSSWDKEACRQAVLQAKSSVVQVGNSKNGTKTPGKYIQVHELRGVLPKRWLAKQESDEYAGADTGDYLKQSQYVVLCDGTDTKGRRKGITLWKGPDPKESFKAIKRDDIFGRACGMGGVEELFEPQTWANYDEIRIQDLLDQAALAIMVTDDPSLAQKNTSTKELPTGAILELGEGKTFRQADTVPRGINLFESKLRTWEDNARQLGAVSEAALGVNPSSGTPFATVDAVLAEGQGTHEYRRGKLAEYISGVYRDWILPDLVAEMKKGRRWLDELSLDELQSLAKDFANNEANARIKAKMLAGVAEAEASTPQQREELVTMLEQSFINGGGKRFIELVENELDDLPIDVAMNVAGKQKRLAKNADGLTRVFQQLIAAPGILKVKGMAKLFNEIVESSGFSAVDFSDLSSALPDTAAAAPPEPMAAAAAA